ncbi:hypothetical protein KSS87_006073 [Heliosperma pusillum]|nr:hypothetical protein KSS87_006073 [Heliosperma pusillum]
MMDPYEGGGREKDSDMERWGQRGGGRGRRLCAWFYSDWEGGREKEKGHFDDVQRAPKLPQHVSEGRSWKGLDEIYEVSTLSRYRNTFNLTCWPESLLLKYLIIPTNVPDLAMKGDMSARSVQSGIGNLPCQPLDYPALHPSQPPDLRRGLPRLRTS